ncbi:MAG TPA: HXXEE domain-containing protein [Pyrinomonadaceae bacterium]|jgi:hypothetical protein
MHRLKAHLSDTSVTFWSWLFPITFLMHFAEEYWFGGGYIAYLKQTHGIDLPEKIFLIAQGIGLVLMLAGILIARRLGFIETMLVIFGAVITANGLTHIITSILQSMYGPGLITSIFVWLPLGLATLIRFHGNFGSARYWFAVLVGVGINIVVVLFTLRGGV